MKNLNKVRTTHRVAMVITFINDDEMRLFLKYYDGLFGHGTEIFNVHAKDYIKCSERVEGANYSFDGYGLSHEHPCIHVTTDKETREKVITECGLIKDNYYRMGRGYMTERAFGEI